jgi:hypothetical protein
VVDLASDHVEVFEATVLLVGPNWAALGAFETASVGNLSGSGDDLVGVIQGFVKISILMKTKISIYGRV